MKTLKNGPHQKKSLKKEKERKIEIKNSHCLEIRIELVSTLNNPLVKNAKPRLRILSAPWLVK